MSNAKKRKIKQLRKSHVLPSIILFIASILISIIVMMFCIGFVIGIVTSEKLNNSANDVTRISRIISDGIAYEDEASILEHIIKYTDSSEAICITDSNGNALASHGDATFETKNSGSFDFSDENVILYFDKETISDFISDSGDILISASDISEIIRKTFAFDPEMDHQKAADEVIISECYWLSYPIEGTDNHVLERFELTFKRSDLFVIIAIWAVLGVLMLIPVFFQFVNVIMNVCTKNKMRRLIYTDTVTGGNNRLHFEHYAERALNSPFSSRKLIAVVDLTIMKYRSFCAYHGVEEGENLLERTDRFLSSVISKKEYCAYMGKASFALLLNCESKEECEDRLYRIMNGLPRAINHDNAVFHCGVFFAEPAQSDSILIKRKDTNISELYSYAGSARAAIADESANGVAIFDRALLEAQLWEHKVEEKMQKALENEEFVVYIQPKYNPVTNKLAGAEALVRWINEEDGFIPPGKFIPIFEKDGFIPKLDDYMISHVAKLQAEWLKEGKMLVPISVNVSRAHFATPNLAQHICSLVDVYGVPHRFIEIELTESAFFDDKNILLNTVNELKAAGFKVSMDDFGAGYSSLNSLKDLPLDVLKLDADFFRGGEAERGEIVVSEAIQLAKKLNMKVVAEGVEKKNQVDFLAEHGCDMIQGYYYAKPMPADEYKEKMRLCEYPIVGELPQLIEKQQ